MRKGEVWWAKLPLPAGRRPVVLLSRDEAYAVRNTVTVAEVRSTIRGIPIEVPLGEEDGLPKKCVVNSDMIATIRKELLDTRISILSREKIEHINAALKFALAL